MLAELRPTVGLAAGSAGDLTPALWDGYEVHQAALRRGLDVSSLARQVLTARPHGGGPELVFVHGIPQSSSLSAVTYAQERGMRRELLARAGLPVPAGATFAIGRERKRARRFASSIGYPVVVKPAVGENMSEVFPGLRDEAQLDAAIEYLLTPEDERPTFSRAAYALTLLLEPKEEDGRRVAPAGYQFLVERHVSGQYLRQLVIGDRVYSAVHCPSGLAGAATEPGREVTGEVHESIQELAVAAVRAVPGLAVAAVDFVLADHRRPAAEQELWIVDLSERPLLHLQSAISPAHSHDLGDAILAHHAAELSQTLEPARDEVAVDFRLEGSTDTEGTLAAVARAADRHGLSLGAPTVDPVEGTAQGTLQGTADRVALVLELLLAGRLDGERVMRVDEWHRTGTPPRPASA